MLAADARPFPVTRPIESGGARRKSRGCRWLPSEKNFSAPSFIRRPRRTYDIRSTAGGAGGSGPADQAAAAAVTTGLELAIPPAAIGNPAGPFKVSAHVNGSNHDFLSNQSLGGFIPPQGNLGGDGAGHFTGGVAQIDLNQFPGDQFLIVPEPGSLALRVLGVLARRRR